MVKQLTARTRATWQSKYSPHEPLLPHFHLPLRGSYCHRPACSDAATVSAQPRHFDGKAISARTEQCFPVGFNVSALCFNVGLWPALPAPSQLARLASARVLSCAEMHRPCTSPARSAVCRIGLHAHTWRSTTGTDGEHRPETQICGVSRTSSRITRKIMLCMPRRHARPQRPAELFLLCGGHAS